MCVPAQGDGRRLDGGTFVRTQSGQNPGWAWLLCRGTAFHDANRIKYSPSEVGHYALGIQRCTHAVVGAHGGCCVLCSRREGAGLRLLHFHPMPLELIPSKSRSSQTLGFTK